MPLPAKFPDPKALRTLLDRHQKRLLSALKGEVPTEQLLKARCRIFDQLLALLWQRLGLEHAALIAVGGYGTGELFPHSDIDLLILTVSEEPSPEEVQRLSLFLNFLWDLNVKVGHSVRSLEECLIWARCDQTVMTNLLTRRLLAGNLLLFEQLGQQLPSLWSFANFYEAKLSEQSARHRSMRNLSFAVEPNLKEALGGLRDLQLLRWLLQYRFGQGDFELLVERGLLTETLKAHLEWAERYLQRLRFALHLAAGRDENILRFEYQKTVASWLGFHGEGNAPSEAMMETCFRAMRQVVRISDLVLSWLDPEPGEERINLDLSFQIRGHYLALRDPEKLWQQPFLALELFRKRQQYPELRGIAPETLKVLFEALEEVVWGVQLRADREANALFLDMLKAPEGVARQLFAMHRSGLLTVFLPEFGFITGKMQFDLFHRHPVDEHILQTVLELRHMAQARYRQELPLAHDLFAEIARPELLYLAALFHDIGKGYGQDHSLVGERLWRAFARRLGLTQQESELVAWLVRHHLLLSTTSQKEDISDPEVVARFAEQVGTEDRLRHLYLLTVADIQATNPKLWNPWRDALLRELFLAARRFLQQKVAITVDRQAVIEEKRQQARRKLRELGLMDGEIGRLWRDLPREYFLSVTVDELVWQTLEILEAEDFPHVAYWPETDRGNDEIFIYTPDRPQLFTQIAAILARMGLNIVRADLYTSRHGLAIDRFQVLELEGGNVLEWERQQRICQRLKACLKVPSPKCFEIRQRRPKIDRALFPPKITFRQKNLLTRLELIAADRPGLLSEIGHAFAQLGLNLHRAHVVTLGMRVEDIFYLSNHRGAPLTLSEQQQLKAAFETFL